jgi:hypothetical protein
LQDGRKPVRSLDSPDFDHSTPLERAAVDPTETQANLMRVTVEFLGWTLDVNLDLTSNMEDEEKGEADRLTTSENSSVGFTADPAFRDLYPEEDEE